MADNVSIQGLQFEISTKTSESSMTANIKRFFDALQKISGSSEKASGGLQKLSGSLSGFNKSANSKKLDKLASGLSALGSVKLSTTIAKNLDAINQAAQNISQDAIDRVKQLADSLQNLQGTKLNFSINNGNGSASVQGQPQIPQNNNQATQQKFNTSGVSSFRDALSSAGGAISGFFGRIKQIPTALAESNNGFSRAAMGAIGLGKALGSKLAAGVKAVTSGLGKLRSAVGFIKSLPGKFIGMIPGVSALTSRFGNLFNSIKRIALYRSIRFFFAQLSGAMREGINNLYQYSAAMGGTFKNSMDSLASSFLYLKNSMGAMVAPLINALAPAVEYVIDKFVGLLNIVNQFFSALTGKKTTTVAKRVPTAFKELGDSASDAAGNTSQAVKELKKSLLGFDELNILNDNKNPSGGGSGGSSPSGTAGANYADMFETIDVDSGISDWVKDLKDAFNEGDWKELGTLLGEKINSLADSVDWEGLGHKIGYGINGAVQTAYWMLDTIDFNRLGEHFAELVNGALSEIDFSYVGALMVKGFTSLIDTIIGFLGGLDWGLIGTKVTEFLTGAFNEVTKWLRSYDWSEVGSGIWTKIKEFFTGTEGNEGLQVGDIASAIAKTLGAAVRASVGLLSGFIGSFGADVRKVISDEWEKAFEGSDGNFLVALAKFLWGGVTGIWGWVRDNLIEPFMQGLTNNDNWQFPSFSEIAGKLWDGIKTAWNGIISGAGKIKDDIIKSFTQALGLKDNWEFPSFTDIASAFWEKLKGAFGSVKDFFKELFTGKDATVDLSGLGVSLKDTDIMVTLNGVISKSFEVMEDAWESITNSTVVKTIKAVAGAGWNTLKKAWESVKSGDALKTIKGKIGEKWQTIKDAWGKIKGEGVVKTIKGKIGDGWTRVKDAWGSIKTKAATLKAKVSGGAAGIVDKIKTKWEWLKKHATITIKAKFLDKAFAGLKSAWNSFAGKYNSFRTKANKLTSVIGLTLPGPLSYMAKGGIVRGSTPAIIGEAGKEAVLPLERNLGWQKTLAEQLVSKMGTTQSQSDNAQALYNETVRQNNLLAKQNELLTKILNKDTDVHISTTSIQEGLARKNMRDGKTVVPVY